MIEKCAKRIELLDAYAKAVTLFNETVQTLNETRTTGTDEEYDRVREYVEQIRLECRQARITLQTHRREHGC